MCFTEGVERGEKNGPFKSKEERIYDSANEKQCHKSLSQRLTMNCASRLCGKGGGWGVAKLLSMDQTVRSDE